MCSIQVVCILVIEALAVCRCRGPSDLTQFGFRCGRGTGDAICAVRSHIDLALAQRFGRTAMLALDWAKAFDSVNVGAMITASRRLGLPETALRLISHIDEDRLLSVTDGSTCSSTGWQCFGISQACPSYSFIWGGVGVLCLVRVRLRPRLVRVLLVPPVLTFSDGVPISCAIFPELSGS